MHELCNVSQEEPLPSNREILQKIVDGMTDKELTLLLLQAIVLTMKPETKDKPLPPRV